MSRLPRLYDAALMMNVRYREADVQRQGLRPKSAKGRSCRSTQGPGTGHSLCEPPMTANGVNAAIEYLRQISPVNRISFHRNSTFALLGARREASDVEQPIYENGDCSNTKPPCFLRLQRLGGTCFLVNDFGGVLEDIILAGHLRVPL